MNETDSYLEQEEPNHLKRQDAADLLEALAVLLRNQQLPPELAASLPIDSSRIDEAAFLAHCAMDYLKREPWYFKQLVRQSPVPYSLREITSQRTAQLISYHLGVDPREPSLETFGSWTAGLALNGNARIFGFLPRDPEHFPDSPCCLDAGWLPGMAWRRPDPDQARENLICRFLAQGDCSWLVSTGCLRLSSGNIAPASSDHTVSFRQISYGERAAAFQSKEDFLESTRSPWWRRWVPTLLIKDLPSDALPEEADLTEQALLELLSPLACSVLLSAFDEESWLLIVPEGRPVPQALPSPKWRFGFRPIAALSGLRSRGQHESCRSSQEALEWFQ